MSNSEALLRQKPHRRYNPLTGEWVLVSPHRTQRPWLGQMEKPVPSRLPPYDPACYLCPGNRRAGGKRNPPYEGTYVFDNDFPALVLSEEEIDAAGNEGAAFPLLRAEGVKGVCRVVCFSPRHDLTLPELPLIQVEEVVRTWAEQTEELGRLEEIVYVQIFENKGEMMGCSNPHPHGQIWATSFIPPIPLQELNAQRRYAQQEQRCLLCDYLQVERKSGERLVISNAHFTALVPFWAVWPYELLVLPHRHVGALTDLHDQEFQALAEILKRLTIRYDNLFETSFPYSMGFHQTPTRGDNYEEGHLHLHFYPPLLRSATVRKFMVGFEMLAMPQRDITPELAAERLRSLPEQHYLSWRG